MADKITNSIILGSARPEGDTYHACLEMQQYMSSRLYRLSDYSIYPYDYDFQQADDFFPLISELISQNELLILATPVYWYAASAQLKGFVDRFTDLITIHSALGAQLKGKGLALINRSAADDCPIYFDEPFRLTAKYLGMHWLGHIHFYNGGPSAIDLSRFVQNCSLPT